MSQIPPALIAISGPIGSGKTTLAALLSQRLGWPRAAYGDVVRDEAARLGLSHDRECLQQVGAQLIAAGWEPFTRQVLAREDWTSGKPVIIDGVRHQEAVTTLRVLTTPLPVVVVYLDIPASYGIARARQRDGLDAPAPSRDELHPVEQDLPLVRDQATLILPAATTSPYALADRVIACLGALQARPSEHHYDCGRGHVRRAARP